MARYRVTWTLDIDNDDDSDNPPPGIVRWIGDWQETAL